MVREDRPWIPDGAQQLCGDAVAGRRRQEHGQCGALRKGSPAFVGDAFPDISKEGKTRALPAIWSNRAEFDALVKDFVTHTKTLADVTENSASAGDEYKAAVAAVGNDCKSCHDKFRSK
jgi:cytochrome c556